MAEHRHVHLPPSCLQTGQCSQPICYTLTGFQPCSDSQNMCEDTMECMEYIGTYISIKSRCINRQCRVFRMETQLKPPKMRLRKLIGQNLPKKENESLNEKLQESEPTLQEPQMPTVSPTPSSNDSTVSNLGAFGISMIIIGAVTFVCLITLLIFYFGTRKPKQESSLDKTASTQFNLPPPPAESPPQSAA